MDLDPIVEWVDELPGKDGREVRDPTTALLTLYEIARHPAGQWAKTNVKPVSRSTFIRLGKRHSVEIEAVQRQGFVYARKIAE